MCQSGSVAVEEVGKIGDVEEECVTSIPRVSGGEVAAPVVVREDDIAVFA